MSISNSPVAPTLWRAFALWLATVCLGTLFLGFYLAFLDSFHEYSRSSELLEIPLFAGAFAGIFSLPALLLLPCGIKWSLASIKVKVRYLRLFSLITGLFGLTSLLCYSSFANDSDLASLMTAFAAPYFASAQLAAYRLYTPWLSVPPTK